MQTSGEAHVLFCVGSQSVPRLSAEPQTECAPEDVVTDLQTLNLSACAHLSAAAPSHEM